MARPRSTFGKLQRDRDKQAKAKAKQDRRSMKPEEIEGEEAPPAPVADQGMVMAALAKLQTDLDEGRVGLDEFEDKREELRQQMVID